MAEDRSEALDFFVKKISLQNPVNQIKLGSPDILTTSAEKRCHCLEFISDAGKRHFVPNNIVLLGFIMSLSLFEPLLASTVISLHVSSNKMTNGQNDLAKSCHQTICRHQIK